MSEVLWELIFSKTSLRDFAYLEKKEPVIIKTTFLLLEELCGTKDINNHPKVKALVSKEKDRSYRLRIGLYRLIFSVETEKNVIYIKMFDRRNNVYRRFNRNH